MGTSLLNDHSSVRNAIWPQTAVDRPMFRYREVAEMEAEELIGLDEEDLEEMSAAE